MSNIGQNTILTKDCFYKPSEILRIFNSILASQNTSAKLIFIKGVYLKNQKVNNQYAFCYDILRDEDTQDEITLKITYKQREELKDGNLIKVGGTIDRQLSSKGYIQIMFTVSRIEVVQEQVVSEAEMKMIELRKLKSQRGFKNIDSLLEEKLFTDNKPSVALVFAASSITMADFDAGKNAASSHIDFTEHRVPFSNALELSNYLKKLDLNHYDVIALIRGGGSGIESLDDLLVIETVANLQTPIICAIGHVDEKLFIKNMVDKVASTPNGLGSYFRDMVEDVILKKNKSKAILIEQVRKQFIEQINAAEKRNKELQDKLTKNTEVSKERSEQMQKQLVSMQNELKKLGEQNEKQVKDFTLNNSKLQNSLEELNKRNIQLEQQLANSRKGCMSVCLGIIFTFISFIGMVYCAVVILF